MNGSDDFADLERQLVADANRLHERTVEFVDPTRLVREAGVRRTRQRAAGSAALILVALTTVAVTRTWTNNRSAVVSKLDRPPHPAVVPRNVPPQALGQTRTPIASDATVVKSKIDASRASTGANKPCQPLEFLVTVPDGEGRRAIGRIYCLPVPKDRPQPTGQPKTSVYLLTTRRRIKFDELSVVQQDAVRRLFGIEQPVTRNVTF